MANQRQEYQDSGAIFRNKEKDADHPNWADYNGSATIDGVDYWVSAWIKEGKESGKKFMSLSFKRKEGGGGGRGRGRSGGDRRDNQRDDRRDDHRQGDGNRGSGGDDIPF